MSLDHPSILAVLAQSRRPLGIGEILTALGASPGQRTELKRLMRELVAGEQVFKDGKRFRVERPAEMQEGPAAGGTTEPPLISPQAGRRGRFLIGVLRRHADGFGFVEPLTGGGQSTYLPAEEARRALDGDLIKVEIVPGSRGRTAGRFVELVERRRTHLVGTLARQARRLVVLPLDAALGEVVSVLETKQAREGDLVKVRVLSGPTRREGASGEVVSAIGKPGDPLGEVLETAFKHGFSDEFPEDVLAAAGRVPEEVAASEISRRRDLRALRLVTIDGEDARDFDDAVYVERTKAGWRLVVAIADVAHYVRPGAPLDFEALRRGTSVYFPSFALPMLPERLSNGICSLKPEVERLCLVADMVFEASGAGARCVETELYEGVMRSAARCTYTEVAEVLSGEKLPHREFLRPDFERMEELARRLIASRGERGSIDFDLPEAKVLLDDRHHPVRLEKRERNIAHRIVEEFMLAANEAVARHFSARSLPTVYRVHGEPDEEKLETFLTLARAHGFALTTGEEISGKALNELLKKIAGSPEQKTLNYLLLRSMMQAIYSSQNIGHFGLAAEFYLHFTSPIRRYPDLIVHRLLKEHWARGSRALEEGEAEALEERLDGVSARSSERERAAMTSEREVDSYFSALFLKDHVGEEFEGVVTAVTPFGLFVELKNEYVEGLVKAETVGDAPSFDEERLRLTFADGSSFTLGTEVRVRVASVNLGRRHIDFQLLSVGEREIAERPPAAQRPRRFERREEAERPRRGPGGQPEKQERRGGPGRRAGGEKRRPSKPKRRRRDR